MNMLEALEGSWEGIAAQFYFIWQNAIFSKILYFIACLVATSLPVTGTLIWVNKLRKKSKKKAWGQVKSQIA